MKPKSILVLLLVLEKGICVQNFEDTGEIAESADFSLQRNETSCKDVIYTPVEERCLFVRKNCLKEQGNRGVFDYVSFYFCRAQKWGFLRMIPLGLSLIFQFLGLGLTASNFLCPNLYTLSKLLKLSDNLAGLTLLALGNGLPDVFSTYKAMSSGSGSLALAELMGAAFFTITVIVGTIAVINPFKVSKWLFLREVPFLLCIVVLATITTLVFHLTLSGSGILIGVYALYVLTIILAHSFSKTRARRLLTEHRMRSNFVSNSETLHGNIDLIFLDNLANLPTIENLIESNNSTLRDTTSQYQETSSVIGAAQTEEELAKIESYSLWLLIKDLKSRSHTGHIYLGDKLDRPLTAPVKRSILHASDEVRPHTFPTNQQSSLQQSNQQAALTKPSVNSAPKNMDTSNLQESPSAEQDEQHFPTISSVEAAEILSSPVDSSLWLSKDELKDFFAFNLALPYKDLLYWKVHYVASFPLLIMLKLTVPVREYSLFDTLDKQKLAVYFDDNVENGDDGEHHDQRSDYKMLVIQTFFCINFLNVAIGWNSIWGVICATILSALLYLNPKVKCVSLKVIYYFSSFLGFLASMCWVSLFAGEIVNVLKTLGIIFALSDDILGVTIFALGNSIGDYISNYTVARMGVPQMAFAACFGGPILSISSIGLSGLIILSSNENYSDGYSFEASKTLVIITTSLMISIIFLLVSVSKKDWTIDRRTGFILIIDWVLVTALCIFIEIYEN